MDEAKMDHQAHEKVSKQVENEMPSGEILNSKQTICETNPITWGMSDIQFEEDVV